MLLIAPVVLLSSLEANHPLTPITEPILRTLVFYPQGWMLFHLITGSWVLGMVFISDALQEQPFLAALVLGPIVAAFLMIYPRLLGRVAWGASTMLETEDDEDDPETPTEDDVPDRKKKRRPRKRLPPPSE